MGYCSCSYFLSFAGFAYAPRRSSEFAFAALPKDSGMVWKYNNIFQCSDFAKRKFAKRSFAYADRKAEPRDFAKRRSLNFLQIFLNLKFQDLPNDRSSPTRTHLHLHKYFSQKQTTRWWFLRFFSRDFFVVILWINKMTQIGVVKLGIIFKKNKNYHKIR